MSNNLVYSATTGQEPTGSYVEEGLEAGDDFGPFCFVCGRATDHFAEHDDLVEQGKAQYNAETGNVYRVTTKENQS